MVHSLGWICLCATQLVAIGASGQDRPPSPKEPDPRARRLEEMAILAKSIKIVAIDDRGKEIPTVRAEEPLLRWTDPTREFSDGGMWVWRARGRPVALVGIERYALWGLEFVSLSPGLVRGKYEPARVSWRPQKAGAEFHVIASAPAPGKSEAVRFRQMRELATRFTAHEVWNGQRHYALRLLPRPIDRYSSPASGTLDGGLFIFGNGTNPEILLMIEARRHGDDPAKWSFAAMPFSHAEVTLNLDAKEAWTSPSKDSGPATNPSDPYYDTLVPPPPLDDAARKVGLRGPEDDAICRRFVLRTKA